jgi:glycogen debranching enzyme
VRRFWKGEGRLGDLATALAGSEDVFDGPATRSVNFVAAHDGFALADLVAYAERHNHANGEANRDGHGENHSWNNGAEGPSDDPAITAARTRDLHALLATLFAARGTIMLTAGDEFGRSQGGNNNAYAQDNETTWLDWEGRDRALEAHVAALAALRDREPLLRATAFLTGEGEPPDVAWLRPDGRPMDPADWEAPGAGRLAMVLSGRLAVLINRDPAPVTFHLPGTGWTGPTRLEGRAVGFATREPPPT